VLQFRQIQVELFTAVSWLFFKRERTFVGASRERIRPGKLLPKQPRVFDGAGTR
jgi:hypothetical protein